MLRGKIMNNVTKKELIEGFKKPDTKYNPNLMWFWNDVINKDEIEFQIKEFKKSNIYEFFIHPLWGYNGSYLTEEFFDKIKFAVKVAKENGMKFWIYDEYNWPSGTAGGYVLRDNPETIGTVLLTAMVTLYAGQSLSMSIQGELVGVQLEYINKNSKIEDVTDRAKVEKVDGQTYVFCDINSGCTVNAYVTYAAITKGICASGMWASFSWYQGGYLDTNDRAAVKVYLDSTYEKYKDAIGEEFGKTVLGVFSDEANNMSFFDSRYYRGSFGVDTVKISPWSKNFLEEFKKDNGYDLRPYVYTINTDKTDDESLKVKFDFWKTATRMFSENYFGQIAEWCEKHNLILTGHCSGEESVTFHAYQMGDFYESLSKYHYPGIDNLFSKEYVGELMLTVNAKLAATVGKLCRRERIMCETFSGSGWDMKMEDAKRVISRLITHGINMIQYMGAYYSLNESRKRFPLGYPPSHNYNNPLFKYYDALNDYTARLSFVSSKSTMAGKTLIVLPMTAVKMQNSLAGLIDHGWRTAEEALFTVNQEFDTVSEAALTDAYVKDGKLYVKGFEYNTVIYSSAVFAPQYLFDLMEEMIKQKGKTIFINELPQKAADTGRIYDFSKYCDNVNTFRILFENDRDKLAKDLDKAIGEGNKILTFENQPSKLYIGHRDNNLGDFFIVCNDNREKLTLKGTVKKDRELYLLNAHDGSIKKIASKKVKGYREFVIDIDGFDTFIIASTDEDLSDSMVSFDSFRPNSEIVLEKNWSFTANGGNYLILPSRFNPNSVEDLKLYDSGKINEFIKSVSNCKEGQASFGISEIPGGYGVDLGDRYVTYAEFVVKDIPSELELIVELEKDMKVFLNGEDITGSLKHKRIWGIREAVCDVQSKIKQGVNTFITIAYMPDWKAPHGAASAYVKGSFKLDENNAIIKADGKINPDIWTKQGYLHFSGTGTYTTKVDIKDYKKVLISVPTTDVVEIVVNGKSVKTLRWPPYEADITEYLVKGENEIALNFTSTYKSLMEPETYRNVYQGVVEFGPPPTPAISGLIEAPVIKIEK